MLRAVSSTSPLAFAENLHVGFLTKGKLVVYTHTERYAYVFSACKLRSRLIQLYDLLIIVNVMFHIIISKAYVLPTQQFTPITSR